VYCLSYPHPSFKNWLVVYKVHRKMHTHVEGHENDDIYQEEIEVDKNFTVYDRACLTELDTGDVELLDKEASHSNKPFQKSKRLLERQERRERLDARVTEVDSDADDA
jgi:hypothetical protein